MGGCRPLRRCGGEPPPPFTRQAGKQEGRQAGRQYDLMLNPLESLLLTSRRCLPCPPPPTRPADSATWTEQTGAAAPPALVICKGPIGQRPRHLVTVQAGLLVDGSSWAEQVQRNALQAGTAGKGPEAGLLAVTLASLLLHSIHAASRMELLWQRLAKGFGVMLRLMGWEQALVAAAVVVALLALKKMLDVLTGEGGWAASDHRHSAVLVICLCLCVCAATCFAEGFAEAKYLHGSCQRLL